MDFERTQKPMDFELTIGREVASFGSESRYEPFGDCQPTMMAPAGSFSPCADVSPSLASGAAADTASSPTLNAPVLLANLKSFGSSPSFPATFANSDASAFAPLMSTPSW